MKYRFPCDKCGQVHLVGTSQAGERIGCACGQVLEVPTLRGIRQLEPAEDAPPAAPVKTWSRGQGLVFAAGLLVAVGGLALASVALVYRSHLVIPERPQYDAARDGAEIDAWSPSRAWDEWVRMRDRGLGPYIPPGHYVGGQIYQWLTRGIYAGSGVLLVGLLLAAAACLLPGGKPHHSALASTRPGARDRS